MSRLVDLPLEIIIYVFDLSNLDREILRYTCKSLYEGIPWSPLLYDDPINSPYSINQLPLLLSNETDKLNDLSENAIKRGRIDLLEVLKPLTSNKELKRWNRIAALAGNIDTYRYIYNFNNPDDRVSDPYLALTGGNMNIFNFLEEKGCVSPYEDKIKNAISYGAIISNKLEIVVEIYDRGYSFSENCIQKATDIDIVRWLYGKGFIANNITLEVMAQKKNLDAIKLFYEMGIISRDVICDSCLSGRFIDGVKFLLESGYELSYERNRKYEFLI